MLPLLQVPEVQGVCGVGEQPSGPMKLTWRQGQPAPELNVNAIYGAAVVHGSTAYFSSGGNYVFAYTVPDNKWTTLPDCKNNSFAMAVINDKLTTIGGWDHGAATNTLLSLSGSSWEDILPPMPTKRLCPAAANTPTHLVVAGGRQTLVEDYMATVEVLNMDPCHGQWSTASSLPVAVGFPKMAPCGGCLYVASQDNNVFSCCMKDLLKSTDSSDGGSVWTALARIPVPLYSSLATLRRHVLAIGGTRVSGGDPTGAIHCYDVATNSWSVVGQIPTPRYHLLTAVLHGNKLVVVGGVSSLGYYY